MFVAISRAAEYVISVIDECIALLKCRSLSLRTARLITSLFKDVVITTVDVGSYPRIAAGCSIVV